MRDSSVSNSGFTLIEMSVVLVIIGLLMVSAFSLGTSQLTLNRIATTKTKQEAVKNALMGFILRNNRLPCPAVATLAPGTTGYGVEAANVGVCTNTQSSGGVSTGVLPWSSLGLSDEGAQDAYYRRFTYQVTTAATGLGASTVAGMVGNITIHSNTPIALSAPSAGNQTNDCANGLLVNPCAAVAVVISHGANAFGSYSVDGVRSALSSGSDEVENANDDGRVVMKDFSDNTGNPFDDIMLTMTVGDLLTPLIKDGGIKSTQASLLNQYETIIGVVVTDATQKRIGSTSPNRSYPLIVETSAKNFPIGFLPSVITLDPWGTQIRYESFISQVTITSNGLLPAFRLTSFGPDKIYGTADDLVRTVTVEELQAKFSTYGW